MSAMDELEALLEARRRARCRVPRMGSDYNSALVSPMTRAAANATQPIHKLITFDAMNEGCDPGYPQMITVHVDYDIPAQTSNPLQTNILEAAKVYYQWGVVGHVARADLVRGVPVTLAGSRVIVGIEYPITEYSIVNPQPPAPQFVAFQPAIFVKVSCGLSGTKASTGLTGNARFTTSAQDITVNSTVIPIPEWAVSFVIQTNDAAVVALEARQFADPNAALAIAASNVGKADQDSTPVANGAVSMILVNNGLVDATGVRVIFYLGI